MTPDDITDRELWDRAVGGDTESLGTLASPRRWCSAPTGRASANTAVLRPDGSILISINEGKDPEALERRLVDLGVPAVVDFLDSGFGCDPARSTGWVPDPPGEELFGWDPASPDLASRFVLHPDQLGPGETAVFEFQIDEHGGQVAANVTLRLSTSEVGPCEPVPNASIVDAEGGVAGG